VASNPRRANSSPAASRIRSRVDLSGRSRLRGRPMRRGSGLVGAGGFNSGLDSGQHYAPLAVASNRLLGLTGKVSAYYHMPTEHSEVGPMDASFADEIRQRLETEK